MFLDACSGSGAVGGRAIQEGFQLISNDLLPFATHVARGRYGVPLSQMEEARSLIGEINQLPPREGHFYHSYSPAGGRKYLTEDNAKRVDSARAFIQQVKDPALQSYLYLCLIEALCKVENTTGIHGAYLKAWKRDAHNLLIVAPEPTTGDGTAVVFNRDIHDLLEDPGFRSQYMEDVLYIDPPYVSREYAPNYHLYEALVAPQDPVVRGITGLPEGYARSEFCGRTEAVERFLKGILNRTRASLVAISYSSDGTVKLERLTEILTEAFPSESIEVHVKGYPRYKSDGEEAEREYNTEYLREYLLIVRRSDGGGLF